MSYWFARQHTIGREVWRTGIGLHCGARISLRLKPAPPDFGVRFRRVDLPRSSCVIAHYRHVIDTRLATSIGYGEAVISTIEHLMAALLGSGVDNALVEVDGPEVPIFDGSALSYLELLRDAGLASQRAPRRCLKILRPLVVNDGEAYVKVSPSRRLRVHYRIDFPHPLVGKQEFSWSFNKSSFVRDIAKARTFGFLSDALKLQRMGLAQGGSLDNAVVFDEERLLNRDGFRYDDECVRHKILDLLGDLALVGFPLVGRIEAYKAGHALHTRFLNKLVNNHSEAYAILPTNLKVPPCFLPPCGAPAFSDGYSPVLKAL